MPCYHPVTAYRSPRCLDLKSGKPKVFHKEIYVKAWPGYETFQHPCGQCIGCRLERSRQWAVRCVHEAKLYDENCFITLTYNDTHMPKSKSLVKKDFQDFMKRIRIFAQRNRNFKKECRKKYGKDFLKIRFFHCGEYGTVCKTCNKSEHYHRLDMEKLPVFDRHTFEPALGRPHYHACLFDFNLPDKELAPIKQRKGAPKIYVSKFLQRNWKFGFSTVGEVTFESAAYVARYVAKKITGKEGWFDKKGKWHSSAAEHYGEKTPEYTTMSRGGRTGKGIAYEWYKKFKADVFPCDNVVLKGVVMKPPKYYDRCFDRENPDAFARVKQKRLSAAESRKEDNMPARLAVQEQIKNQQFALLKRGLEND